MKKLAKRFFSKIFHLVFVLAFVLLQFAAFTIPNPVLSQTAPASLVDEIKTLNEKLKSENEQYKSASDSAKVSELGDLKTVAADRKAKLKQLIGEKPADVGQVVFDDVSIFPADIQGDLEKKSTEKGYYQNFHIDGVDSVSEEAYLNKNSPVSAERLQLFAEAAPVDFSFGNKEISLNAYVLDGLAWYRQSDNSSLIYPAQSSFQANSQDFQAAGVTGQRKFAVYYISFVDYRQRDMTEGQIMNYLNGEFKSFVNKSSSGKVSIVADTFYQLDLPINKTCNKETIVFETDLRARETYFANPANFTDNLIIADWGGDNDCKVSGWSLMNSSGWMFSYGTDATPHEFGHNMFLAHASSYDCKEYMVVSTGCEVDKYGNFTDLMGSGHVDTTTVKDYGGYAKEYLGWFSPSEIADASAGGTFTVYRIEEQAPPVANPFRVIKIKTFDGGPKYYIQYRREQQSGPTLELASGTLGPNRITYLLDTTPDSTDVADFRDGGISDGQTIVDSFNGIVIKGISHDSRSATVEIQRVTPQPTSSTLRVTWSRPRGYLEATGQKKDVSWSPVRYVFSHRCVAGFGCDPNAWTDEPATTNSSGTMTVARASLGYVYEYRVMILTKADNNPNELAFYPWVDLRTVTNECGGQTSCTITISWPTVNYRASVLKKSDGTEACQTVIIGCLSTYTVHDVTTFMARGLPKNVDFRGKVEVFDVGGVAHLLQDIPNLGSSDSYVRWCQSFSAYCSIYPLTFIGNEPVSVQTKLNDAQGSVVDGPYDSMRASPDGSFTWGWVWDYAVVAFPKYLYNNCYEAGADCLVQSYSNSVKSTMAVSFSGVKPATTYKVTVCAPNCNPPSGNSVVGESTIQSAGFGPTFFGNDPFAPPPPVFDNDGDGCTDVQEQGTDWRVGGQRDPYNQWDFFDVPVPAIEPGKLTGTKSKAITLGDVMAILRYVGTSDGGVPNANKLKYNDDLNGNGIPDGREYDRSPGGIPGQPWRSGPPNGSVTIQDALVALAQVGTNCN